jgi:hypothetical protein
VTDLGIARDARADDRSAYRPGRTVVQHLLGAVPASVIAMADDPLGAMLVPLEGDRAREALLRAIHVPHAADELDGPRSRMLASCFARIEEALVSDV